MLMQIRASDANETKDLVKKLKAKPKSLSTTRKRDASLMKSSQMPKTQSVDRLSILRVLLHAVAVLLLSFRSSQLGSALHPFQRAIANDWVRLLFYVDASKKIGDDEEIVTLPHFLLEAEEEIAANVDDQFFSGGFAARTSALPVGALFTIEETRQHLHGAVLNYFRLADVALDSYVVYSNDSAEKWLLIPPPLLTVRADRDDETLDQKYTITNASVSDQWPAPLRMGASSARQQETRAFFDALDAMELKVVVGMKRKEKKATQDARVDKLYEWTIVIRYDLLNQGHLEVTLNYNLVHVPLLEGKRKKEGETDMPPVLLDSSVSLNWVTLVVLILYQASDGSCCQCVFTNRLTSAFVGVVCFAGSRVFNEVDNRQD